MSGIQKITAWVIFGGTVAFLAYDVVAYLYGGVTATLSWVVYTQSKIYEAIPFSLGFLMGHLFGQMKPDRKKAG